MKNLARSVLSSRMRSKLKEHIPARLAVSRVKRDWKKPDPAPLPLEAFSDRSGIERYQFSVFSQNGEDGIIQHILSQVGFESCLFIEFGFGLFENNSLRLMLREGFGGLYIDGSRLNVEYMNRAIREIGITNVSAVCQFLTTDNIEQTIASAGLSGSIDFLSIDVDGNDYWFWERLSEISPRVVAIEYNASFGPDKAITIPYDPAFERHEKHESGFYAGASLPALTKLGAAKGYELVGCDSSGANAFFVRRDCLVGSLTPMKPGEAYRPNAHRINVGLTTEEQFALIAHLPFVTV